ncbi:serine/threonine kinase [Aureococcus anophagefferens]|nr:serine/threonine kinase [Aureococcus anophagefferens]
MEVLAGPGFAGVNGVVKAVTGKSILQHCGIAVNRLRANVLGIGADSEFMGQALADKAADEAWKVAEAKLAGPDRDERRLFSRRLEALSDVLQSVASSPAVEDDADGRRSSEADIDNYKQDLQLAFLVANHDDREMLATEDSFTYDPYDSDDPFQEASQLGEGSFGATHTMRNIDDGQLYAVKLIKIKKAGVPIENLQQEASHLAKLHHPNIVRYYTSFKKKPFFAIVTELLTGGSLLERIDGAAGPLPAGQIKRWTIQIASAQRTCARRMQHRDLKPDNVLFDALGDARLIDLGLAQIVVAKSKVSSGGGKNAVGAELYRSPEKALGNAYDAKDDIWALGCMVAGAATGKSLETRSASGAGLFALNREKVKSLVDEAASSPFGELVAATLQKYPIARPAAEIIELALRSGKSLAAAARDGTIFEEEDDDATSDALDDVPYAEVVVAPVAVVARVGVGRVRGDLRAEREDLEPSGDAPSENGLGKVRASATSAGSTANGTPTAAEADAAASRGDFGPLVAVLRTGTDGAKKQAAGALWNSAHGNADNQVAIAKAGAVDPLVALLRTGTDGAKEHAAGALSNLAGRNADNQIAIAEAGAVDPLVGLLRTGTDGIKEQAAGALRNLSVNADNQIAIAKAGAADPLVGLLRTGTDGAKEQAAAALKNLSVNDDNKVAITKAGALDPLVGLLRTGTDGIKEQAAGALRNLAFENADNKVAIAKAGAADPLVALLRTGTDGAKEQAAGALKNLARGAESRAAVAQALSLSAAASKSDVAAAVDKLES